MQVHVGNFLAGRLAIGQPEVDAVAAQRAFVERGGYFSGDGEHDGPAPVRRVLQGTGVLVGHDEGVACVDWLDVQEGGAAGVAQDEARG